MTTWKTMDSAPRNGEHFLGATEYGVLRLHWWDVNKNGETRFCNFIGDCGNAYYPTDWMPLPKPPK